MNDLSSSQAPSTWAGPSTRPPPPRRDPSQRTIRGFDVPQGPHILPPPPPLPAALPSQPPSWLARDVLENLESHVRPRRASVAARLGSLGNIGGVNSLNNFASSFQRAAGFYEATHRSSPLARVISRSSPLANAANAVEPEQVTWWAAPTLVDEEQPCSVPTSPGQRPRDVPDPVLLDVPPESIFAASAMGTRIATHRRLSGIQRDDSSTYEPPATNGPSYGTLSSGLNEPGRAEAHRLYTEQQNEVAVASSPDKEREPLLLKRVETQSGPIRIVVGQSTLYQTVFNSVNVLVGVGMLSLPLALKFSGWVIGLIFFTLSAVITSYTARLLAKCIDVDPTLVTFVDIAYIAYGRRARVYVSILFAMELIAACVALVILFADSVDLLIPGWGVTQWKVLCGLITIPLGLLPMRFLGFTSIIGILGCMTIVLAVFIDGFIKPHSPGSLIQPAPTSMFPEDWRTLGLGFGMLMATWGGHAVFPNIYRDMRHPQKYAKAVRITYVFTFILESALAIAGYLMYGDGVRDEITANIFLTEGYPKVLSVIIVVAIAIIPLTKLPLSARPLISTMELFLGISAHANDISGMSPMTRGFLALSIRIFVPVLLVVVAIAVPSFDRVMSLLGSLACFSICIVLPCCFHQKIFSKELGPVQTALDRTLIVVFSIMAFVGTVCSFLPKTMLGAE